jgi:hypothetical protein
MKMGRKGRHAQALISFASFFPRRRWREPNLDAELVRDGDCRSFSFSAGLGRLLRFCHPLFVRRRPKLLLDAPFPVVQFHHKELTNQSRMIREYSEK